MSVGTFSIVVVNFNGNKGALTTRFTGHKRGITVVRHSSGVCKKAYVGVKYVPAGALIRRTGVTSTLGSTAFRREDRFCQGTISIGRSIADTLQGGGCRGLTSGPGIAICANVNSFISTSIITIHATARRVQLASGRVVVGAKTRAIVPPVRKITNGPFICADASVVRLTSLPHHLIVVNNNCVNLRFTSVCTSFNSRIAILRDCPRLVIHRSHSVTTDMGRALRGGNVIFQVGTGIRSIGHIRSGTVIAFTSSRAGRIFILRTSTILLTAKQQPGAGSLGLRITKMRISIHKTVVISRCLGAAGPGVHTMNSIGNKLRFACVSLSSCQVIHRSLFNSGRQQANSHGPIDCSIFVSPPLSHVNLGRRRTHQRGQSVVIGGLPIVTVPETGALKRASNLLGTVVSGGAKGVLNYMLFTPSSNRMVGAITITVGAKRSCAFLHSFVFARPDVDRTLGSLFSW